LWLILTAVRGICFAGGWVRDCTHFAKVSKL
jgi:hypothetical protein